MKKVFFKKQKKGFTLIELLVVIAIIGFIAIIVYANLHDARQRAQSTKIVEEINQLSKAFELYKTDKGSYPGESSGGVQFENDNAINYLNNTLVALKFIPIIPQYGGDSNLKYAYYSGGYVKSDIMFKVTPISCGGKVINNYIFIFEDESLDLNLPRFDLNIYKEGYETAVSGYCIGQ